MTRIEIYDKVKEIFPHFSDEGLYKLIDFIEDNFAPKEA